MRVSKLILFLLSTGMAFGQNTKPPVVAGANEVTNVNATTIQVSEFYGGNDCVTREADIINVINAAVSGVNNTCLELQAAEVIDISDFFEAEGGSQFDARIGSSGPGEGEPNPNPNPGQTGGWIDTTPDSEKICENLINHGPANPHLYAHASSNSFTGDLMAKYAPEYMVEGLTGWKKMYTAGSITPNSDLKYFFFHEPSDGGNRNIILRTKAGCPEYRDIRNIKLNTNTLEDWYGLPNSIPALNNPTAIDVNFMINSEMENRGLREEIAVYNLFADRVISNLALRVNGYSYAPFRFYDYPLFTIRTNRNLMDTPPLFVSKDFYMDVSTDGFSTAARYTVYRNYQGGHWSVVTTATRHDSRVTVTAQGISWEMDQFLVNQSTGQSYASVAAFGNVFDLGYLADGDYIFALKTYHGVTINNRILVRVKRPPLN